MLYIAGITVSVFLFLALLFKKNKGAADRILACWMWVAVVHQLLFYLSYAGFDRQYPHLLGLALPIPVLYSPMLYLYVAEITGAQPFRRKTAWLHFMPFLLLVVLAAQFYSLSGAEKLQVFENQGRGYEWYQFLKLGLFVVLTLGYTVWSSVLIRRSRRRVEDLFSNTEKRNLIWLEYMCFGLCGICLLVLLFDDRVVFAGVTLLMFFAGLYGINQTSIFQSNSTPGSLVPEATPDGTASAAETGRYAKSGLKEADADHLYLRLTALIQQEKPFENPDLTLTELAKTLDVHPNYLSQVINEKAQKNFYNYINTLRIEEFLRLAAQPENKRFTLLALAFDCGFNSKSTFNKYFKTHTGKTPSEFFVVASA